MQHVLGPLHGGLGPAALGLLLAHPRSESLDDGHQCLTAVLAEQFLIERVHMVEAVVMTDGGGNGWHGVDQSLRLLPADAGAHESPGIHRRVIGAAAHQRLKMVEKLVRGCAGHLQRPDLGNGTDAVFPVDDLVANRKHKIFPLYYF